jgi:putative endonuclease
MTQIPIAKLGRRGENRAVWHYRLRGYRILARNVRLGRGEIDLVVRRGRTVAFVEVKTRQRLGAGQGFEAVDQRKEKQLADLADRYLSRHRLDDCEIRFDVVSLLWTGRRFRLSCFRDAFRIYDDWR